MNTHKRVSSIFLLLLVALFSGWSLHARAAIITVNLGNTASGFADNDILTTVQIAGAQAGQPAPFASGIGSEVLASTSNATSWLFSFAAITDTILNATLSFGIADHDSAASGSQLDNFSLDGVDATSILDALFEASAATDQQYDIFSLNLGSAFFAALADGMFQVDLDLGGAGLTLALFGPNAGNVVETSANGYFLIFSTLTIETQDSTQPPSTGVPEPGSLLLLLFGLLGVTRRSSFNF